MVSVWADWEVGGIRLGQFVELAAGFVMGKSWYGGWSRWERYIRLGLGGRKVVVVWGNRGLRYVRAGRGRVGVWAAGEVIVG